MSDREQSFLSRIIASFLQGNLTVLLIVISLLAGAAALYVTPREEEPQIVVPLADVLISYPGGSAEEVEKLVASRLERLLYQIDGVEYVYSMSRPGMAVVTVRFYVGEDREKSLIKLYNKVLQNVDKTTPGIAGWVIKPVEIDDVPILNATLYSRTCDEHQLYRIGEEVAARLQKVSDSSRVTLHGGRKRVIQVYLDTERLSAYGLSAMEIAGALKVSNAQMESGQFSQENREIRVEAGPFLRDVNEVRNLLVGLHGNRPVYLRDVAEVSDGAEEIQTYTRLGFGPAATDKPAWAADGADFSAVTLAVAKKKGSNAVEVARAAQKVLADLRGKIIPEDVEVRITRDYGATANDKVNGLVEGLTIAIITVIGMIALAMNWRVGVIVATAVPITYSLTLLVNYTMGYTINRVTLFALILTLGLLVDDPIVGVENIYRHLGMRKQPRRQAILTAMNEVLPPIVLATLAIIVAFVPLFFITGMMGPYMRPMAINVPLAMFSSMLVSLMITPWVSDKLLPKDGGHAEAEYDVKTTLTYRIYRRVLGPFLASRWRGVLLLLVMGVLFFLSCAMALTGLVPLKMLPFDNKNEFQVVVDMPAGTTLESTAGAVQEIETFLRRQPEVTEFVSTIGAASPMDFNGLVRHYYLRQGPNLADIRVNLLHRTGRAMDSHAIVLRCRNELLAIGQRTGAKIKVVETPPGPPVLATLVAEVYGQPRHSYADLIAGAGVVRARLAAEEGVVDVDSTVEEDQAELFFEVDREKAGLSGVSTEDVVQTLHIALGGLPAGTVHVPTEQNELPIILQLPRRQRSDAEKLKSILIKGRSGISVPLGEIGHFRGQTVDKTIFHKNQRRVVYVTAETAGRGPAYAVLALQSYFRKNPLLDGLSLDWRGEGEWKITLDVFRDLGIAFGMAVFLIYALLVYQMGSYVQPLIVMMSIPLTLIGIMPGFWLLNVIVNRPVGGFATPVFFTATAMIGIIALAGIVVRNGIILIDFIHHGLAQGRPLREAIVESGAVRLRPIVLTAGSAILGAWPITLDPIFSGLAWSLIFGLLVSTSLTLVVIPAVYYLIYNKVRPAPVPAPGEVGGEHPA